MSVSKPWKALERRFAKLMGGERLWRPDFGESLPDGETDTDVWDTKCYQRFSVVEMWIRCYAKYRDYANGRRFVLVLFSRDHPRAGDFVLIRAKDYAELVQASIESKKGEAEASPRVR